LNDHEGPPVRVVADAALAIGSISDGRLIPLVILDTANRPDLEEFIRVHQHISSGDVDIQWAMTQDSAKDAVLILSFKRPARITAVLRFDVTKYGGLVDQILTAKCIYVQAGRDGDRFLKNPNAPKIYVEVPDTGFRKSWDEIMRHHIIKRMKMNGLNRREAKEAATQFISEWRKFSQIRVGGK
jgi:hypothetical protein